MVRHPLGMPIHRRPQGPGGGQFAPSERPEDPTDVRPLEVRSTYRSVPRRPLRNIIDRLRERRCNHRFIKCHTIGDGTGGMPGLCAGCSMECPCDVCQDPPSDDEMEAALFLRRLDCAAGRHGAVSEVYTEVPRSYPGKGYRVTVVCGDCETEVAPAHDYHEMGGGGGSYM